VAGDPRYLQVRDALWAKLRDDLERTGDPRVTGGGFRFDDFPYFGRGPRHPDWERAHPAE
jgi:hypothetical protein